MSCVVPAGDLFTLSLYNYTTSEFQEFSTCTSSNDWIYINMDEDFYDLFADSSGYSKIQIANKMETKIILTNKDLTVLPGENGEFDCNVRDESYFEVLYFSFSRVKTANFQLSQNTYEEMPYIDNNISILSLIPETLTIFKGEYYQLSLEDNYYDTNFEEVSGFSNVNFNFYSYNSFSYITGLEIGVHKWEAYAYNKSQSYSGTITVLDSPSVWTPGDNIFLERENYETKEILMYLESAANLCFQIPYDKKNRDYSLYNNSINNVKFYSPDDVLLAEFNPYGDKDYINIPARTSGNYKIIVYTGSIYNYYSLKIITKSIPNLVNPELTLSELSGFSGDYFQLDLQGDVRLLDLDSTVSSTNPNVVQVDSSGRLSFYQPGTAMITILPGVNVSDMLTVSVEVKATPLEKGVAKTDYIDQFENYFYSIELKAGDQLVFRIEDFDSSTYTVNGKINYKLSNISNGVVLQDFIRPDINLPFSFLASSDLTIQVEIVAETNGQGTFLIESIIE